ncbi:MAG: hypothetical protein AAFV71_28120 [Cyanobacteria bacterium J06633_8]
MHPPKGENTIFDCVKFKKSTLELPKNKSFKLIGKLNHGVQFSVVFTYSPILNFVVANIPQTQSKLLTAPVSIKNLNITISANGNIQPERTVNVSPKRSLPNTLPIGKIAK